MPYGRENYAECPRCGKKAIGQNEIEELFGYRNLGSGKIIPQSHCRECRKEELKENR